MEREAGRHLEQKLHHPDVAVNLFLFSEVAWVNFFEKKGFKCINIKLVELISCFYTNLYYYSSERIAHGAYVAQKPI